MGTDLRILENLAKLLVRYVPESRLYDPIGLVEEFRKTINKEMDFKAELRNAERFRANFAGSKTVFVPGVIKELCAKEVLTMECSHGKKVTELDDLLPSKKKVLAKNLTDTYLKQIFEDGFFHKAWKTWKARSTERVTALPLPLWWPLSSLAHP